jgi:hypothetical protein
MGMGLAPAPGAAAGGPKPAGAGTKSGGALAKGNAFLQALRSAPPEEFGPAVTNFAQGLQGVIEEKYGQSLGAGPMAPPGADAGMGLPTAVPSAQTSFAERGLPAAI